jgi:hypothetical protein
VPADRTPKLAELVEQTPLSGAESATERIRNILYSTAYYTLTPGATPFWKDRVEYFMFEGKKGYCQHFASAAVLMYRLYGVPARYAGGYRASADSFVKQEDGTYKSVLTDENAHAWAEVYDEEAGWLPVEVTPPASGESPLLEDAAEAEAGGAGGEGELAGDLRPYEVAAVGGAALVALVAAALFRRRWVLRRGRAYTADRVFERLLGVLRLGGLMKGFGGNEDGFADALSAAVPSVGKDEAARLVKLVHKDVFGRERASQKETEEVARVYAKTCEAVYAALTPYKKLRFKYLEAYQ